MLLPRCTPESHGLLMEVTLKHGRREFMQKLLAIVDRDGTGGTLAHDLRMALANGEDCPPADWIAEHVGAALFRVHRLYDMHRSIRANSIDAIRFVAEGVSIGATPEDTAQKFRSAARAALAKAEEWQ